MASCFTSIESLISQLESSDIGVVYKALVTLKTCYVQNSESMKKLRKFNVMKPIISFLEHPKLCNIALSMLANCCMDESLRKDVIANKGVHCLIRILKGLANDKIKNRVCRALGNIALCEEGTVAVQEGKPIDDIIQLLTNTDDVSCQQTVLRTLRILGNNQKMRKLIIKAMGIEPISSLLQSKDIALVRSSVKALFVLSSSWDTECARQLIQPSDSVPILVQLYSSTDSEISDNALLCLENLAHILPMRQKLYDLNVLEIFIRESKRYESYSRTKTAISSLCLCCKEYYQTERIKKLGGIPVFIRHLSDSRFEEIHAELIHALTLLCNEIGDLNMIREVGLVPVLIQKLESFIECNKKPHSITDESLNKNSKSVDLEIKVNTNAETKDLDESEIEMMQTPQISLDATCSDCKTSSSGNDVKLSKAVSGESSFSIHSPTYKGVHDSDVCIPSIYTTAASSYTSPPSSSRSPTSPDIFSFNWHPSSPVSYSSVIGPWSPSSSDYEVCWSPVMSTRSDTPESDDELDDICNVWDETDSPADGEKEPINSLACNNTSEDIPIASENVCSEVCENSDAETANIMNQVFKRKLDMIDLQCSGNGLNEISIKKLKVHDEESRLAEEECVEKSDEIRIDAIILHLLAHITRLLRQTTNSEIVEEFNIGVLLNYIANVSTPNNAAFKIIYNLVSNRYCFEKLIMCNFIGQLNQKLQVMHDTKICKQCTYIEEKRIKLFYAAVSTSESKFGVGTLSHILLTAEPSAQLNCMCAVAKLLKSKKCLEEILIDADGMSILFEFLSESQGEKFKIAFECLTEICLTLSGLYKKPRIQFMSADLRCPYNAGSFNVEFLVNDSLKVPAVRSHLIKNSSYFSALLDGYFRETTQDVIFLPDISKDVLLPVFHFLHGCVITHCKFIYTMSVEDMLNILPTAERFLLADVKKSIESLILHRMTFDNIDHVYFVAKSCNCPLLVDSVVSFILCSGEQKTEDHFNNFQRMISSEEHDFTDVTKQFIKKHFLHCRDEPLYRRRTKAI